MDGDTPVITPLEKIPETESYKRLERETDIRLPIIDLSELLLETTAAAPFALAMIEVVDGGPDAAIWP